ncbi:DUF2799 domain-containing protein [Halomonas halocynthiae]|uniref:DUF2799 domain-containing protein n=1 Tax=Halomonas halocynthiae TaxID=176290 RepID=UPI0006868649|nr:DUF2799 domain-containing protein [Halomonas halocynthiae]
MTALPQLALLSALTLLSGCATLSEGQCRTMSWEQLGRMDGREGYPAARLFEHQKACAEYGVSISQNEYSQGREVGLLDYCTPHNGYQQGLKGARYHNVCPARLEAEFLARYRDGLVVHDAESELKRRETHIDRLERQLDSDKLDDKERKRLNHELRNLYRDYRHQQHELIRLEQRYSMPAQR